MKMRRKNKHLLPIAQCIEGAYAGISAYYHNARERKDKINPEYVEILGTLSEHKARCTVEDIPEQELFDAYSKIYKFISENWPVMPELSFEEAGFSVSFECIQNILITLALNAEKIIFKKVEEEE